MSAADDWGGILRKLRELARARGARNASIELCIGADDGVLMRLTTLDGNVRLSESLRILGLELEHSKGAVLLSSAFQRLISVRPVR